MHWFKTRLIAIKERVSQHWITFSSALMCVVLIFSFLALLALIISKGMGHFWPKPIAKVSYLDKGHTRYSYAYVNDGPSQKNSASRIWLQLDTFHHSRPKANVIIPETDMIEVSYPISAHRLELHNGDYILAEPEKVLIGNEMKSWAAFEPTMRQVEKLQAELSNKQLQVMARIHQNLEDMHNANIEMSSPAYQKQLQLFWEEEKKVAQLRREIAQFQLRLTLAHNQHSTVPMAQIKWVSAPNDMQFQGKLMSALDSIVRFVTEESQDGNQSGGVFPAIFGTVLMVLLMTIIVAPLGIVAAIYLTEYAPNNVVVSVIRIAVSNLAGVPSVVYGVFGLGFFVYQVGGNIDALFYPDQLPTPTFGTPGLLWAALTMALLTLPVVIVATEEGLRRVPQGLRHASYALGATKIETIRKIVLPIASSSLMTGIVLAIARGAGEVAPMLMVGAVKYAPVLPVDAEFPFVHLERQFMHLGVMIYDGAFHGQALQQGSTLMFAACLLLLLVVTILNMIAIFIRSRLQAKYRAPHYV